ncbi:hypothetical protein KQX54_009743 [Cotesia glomerata]|uniref:ERAP1-like C-terminal domain-containing protein n=1 Tax=Cotesia glomerata TaxID=32391 RepID=A0AAV7ICV3_COTGL|nr:hypothetical protein KQX54_009743 [Cotesia glomerata]
MEFLGNQILTHGYPVVTVIRNYTASNAVVTQKRFSTSSTKNFSEKFWIPLNCANDSSPTFDDTSINWWLSPDSNEIEIPVAASSDKNWNLILDYLKTSNYHKIHPINRAQIIDDVLTFAEFGYVNHSLVFELTEYLQQETHRIPLAKFLDYFFNIHDSRLLKISDYHKEFEKHCLSREKKKIENIFCNGIREADQKSWDRLFKDL